MEKRMAWILAIALACLPLAACNTQGDGEDMVQSGADMEASSSEQPEEPDEDSTVSPNVLSEILKISADEVVNFTYFDAPPLYYRDDGAVFPEGGAADITYNCGVYGSAYTQEDNALTLQLAQALEAYQIDGQPELVDGVTPLPAGDYFTVWPTLQSDWNPVLTFFDSGEIYIDYNGGADNIHRYWHAADPGQYHGLKAMLEEIHSSLDARPLDYQITMWLSPNYFKPESEALRFGFENIGKDTVTAGTLTISKKVGEAWEPLSEVAADDLAITPRGYTWYAIDLASLPGAQEQGDYMVAGTLQAAGDMLPLALEYSISEDAGETSYPLLPKMTPENQEYCDRYASMWGFYSPFKADFDEDNYFKEFHTYHLYYIMAYTEGKTNDYQKEYGADVPAEVVEGTIMRHFLLTEEQIRAQTSTKNANSSEYYDPGTNTYHFEGGYGGGSLSAVVSDSSREGDLLTLTCDWYGMDDSYQFSQELTLRLGEGEFDFVYVAGRML